jgi:hypothetical protein
MMESIGQVFLTLIEILLFLAALAIPVIMIWLMWQGVLYVFS